MSHPFRWDLSIYWSHNLESHDGFQLVLGVVLKEPPEPSPWLCPFPWVPPSPWKFFENYCMIWVIAIFSFPIPLKNFLNFLPFCNFHLSLLLSNPFLYDQGAVSSGSISIFSCLFFVEVPGEPSLWGFLRFYLVFRW
jgi:hypothetical protein